MSKQGAFSGPYFPALEYLSAFSPNPGKYGPGKTPYLDTFYAVIGTPKRLAFTLSETLSYPILINVYSYLKLEANK